MRWSDATRDHGAVKTPADPFPRFAALALAVAWVGVASHVAAQSAGYEEAVDRAMRLRDEGRHDLAAIAFTNVHDLDAENELAYRYLLEAAQEWNRVPGHGVEVLALLDRVLAMTEDPQGPARRAVQRHRAEAIELREEVLASTPPERLQARDSARRVLAEARAHEQEGRLALAGQSYGQLYDVMRGAGFSRSSVALWNRGRVLGSVPGQEREAMSALRRFLEESTLLETAADVREWRSSAVSLIQELELRAPAAELDAPTEGEGDAVRQGEPGAQEAQEAQGGSVSPVGPILLGVGGAVLLAGTAVGIAVLVQDGDLTAMCSETRCPPEARGLAADVEALALATDVLVIAGAVIAAAGLVLTLTLSDEDASARVQVGPLGVQGAF